MTHFAIIQRKDALKAGLSRYFTGEQCNRGHVAQRFAASGSCVVCQSSRNGGVRLAAREIEKLNNAAGLKTRVILAHDDDWPVLEAMAAAMKADRVAAYHVAHPLVRPAGAVAPLPDAPTMEPR